MEIVVKDLSVVYMPDTPYEKQALSHIDLRIESGCFAAIAGATGSGKSTLIQCMAGLIRPASGQVQVGDKIFHAGSKSGAALRKHVGIVFQYPEHQLFEETIAKDIAFGLKNRGITEPKLDREVHRMMDLVGLPGELSDRSPFHLSGGQMRRVAIAGILALKPDVLIMDEPTAGLDRQGKQELFRLLKDLHEKQGLTVILVTHDMNDVAKYADQVFVLSGGKLALSGTPAEVFEQYQIWQELSLELPQVSQLVAKINEQLDVPLPYSIFTLEELEQSLAKRFVQREAPT
ncbi:energy-coupling factor transporter ATPase [Thermoactinomyces mirandus]|uniref:Energy-coupling factor transporter ATP-binding protein EcfA2 n=1 Tax=Thermoactinomyces mirandus TaxID=2756294 RepID=A0A7W2ASZ4_9BACL|nr:energy-coupling factor transporter ATPase [Thermoactinomyces mirandus]MBA4603200.1 energy-coupling factor transporter ATPase [Thermoactinomyces mirandus]